jgi:hypothetical protein
MQCKLPRSPHRAVYNMQLEQTETWSSCRGLCCARLQLMTFVTSLSAAWMRSCGVVGACELSGLEQLRWVEAQLGIALRLAAAAVRQEGSCARTSLPEATFELAQLSSLVLSASLHPNSIHHGQLEVLLSALALPARSERICSGKSRPSTSPRCMTSDC